MAERKAVTKQLARRYERASKKEKGEILTELCGLTGWTRRHARRALTASIGPAGKRLAPFMAEIVEVLERTGELHVAPDVRTKLLRVSAATIDRMLAPERARLRVKGRSGTKPGTLLKRQIPIRTFAEWNES